MMISSESFGKVPIDGNFPCAVCRKGVGYYSILCQFYRCWVHKRCCGIKGKLNEDSKFTCQTLLTMLKEGVNGVNPEI